MSSEIKKLNAHNLPLHHHDDWKGYTLAELRFERALTLVRMDIAADKLRRQTQAIDGRMSSALSGNLFIKLLSGFNFAEYASMAVRTVRTVVRFWKAMRRQSRS